MKFDLNQALTTNLPIKGTALALAALLWAAVAAQEPTTQLVPVTFNLELPPGRALTQPPGEIQALVSGTAGEMFKLYAAKPVINKRIPDTRATSYTIALSVQDLNFIDDVSVVVQDLRPRELEVYLDTVAQRLVPVEMRAVVIPETGYELVGGTRTNPDSVFITGPRNLVRDISSIPTVVDTVFSATTSISRVIALDTTNFRVVTPGVREVNLIAQLTQIASRVLSNIPVVVAGRAGVWQADETTVTVTVEGPVNRIERLTADSLAVTARPSGDGESVSVRLTVRAPLGISASVTPDSITVRRIAGA